jgi:hypothetical protein
LDYRVLMLDIVNLHYKSLSIELLIIGEEY